MTLQSHKHPDVAKLLLLSSGYLGILRVVVSQHYNLETTVVSTYSYLKSAMQKKTSTIPEHGEYFKILLNNLRILMVLSQRNGV